MNHLHGLKVPDPTADLSVEDTKILHQFRERYEGARPLGDVPDLTHDISNTESLPPTGWRPLDDATLYRFLCADRDKGKFHPDVSLERLLNALQMRKDCHVDEILNVGVEEEIDNPASINNSQAFSLCSGIFSPDDDERVQVTILPRKRLDSYHSDTSVTSATTLSGTSPLTSDRSFITTSTNVDENNPSSHGDPEGHGDPLMKAALKHDQQMEEDRKKRPLSPITPEQLALYQRLRVRVFVGTSRDGSPVMFERLGAFMGSDNFHHLSVPEWITLYLWDLERHFTHMRQAAVQSGKPINTYVYFGDLQGIVRSILTGAIWRAVPLLKSLVQSVEDHYPEIVSHVVVFNVPKVVVPVWEAIKQFLDPVTAAKVQLIAGVPKDIMLSLIDEECLPVEYGGKNTIHFPKAAKK